MGHVAPRRGFSRRWAPHSQATVGGLGGRAGCTYQFEETPVFLTAPLRRSRWVPACSWGIRHTLLQVWACRDPVVQSVGSRLVCSLADWYAAVTTASILFAVWVTAVSVPRIDTGNESVRKREAQFSGMKVG